VWAFVVESKAEMKTYKYGQNGELKIETLLKHACLNGRQRGQKRKGSTENMWEGDHITGPETCLSTLISMFASLFENGRPSRQVSTHVLNPE
jgi:hypothetical protein